MRIAISLSAAIFLGLPVGLSAYDTQLDPHGLHEAYVLGQRNDKATGDFLAPYLMEISEPQNGAHIAQIALLTPYAKVVDQSRQKAAAGYTEEQASQDYRQQGKTITVNVVLMLPAAYPKAQDTPNSQPATKAAKSAIQPENFWQNFRFNLDQNGKTIPSRSMSNKPIYSSGTKDAPSVLDGQSVWLEFDLKDVASEPVTVEVVTPEGKMIKAAFDLKKLR